MAYRNADKEIKFQKWYRKWAIKFNLDTNPDHPAHKYDYRAAYEAGVEPGLDGHWPSEYKKKGHPTSYVKTNGSYRQVAGKRKFTYKDALNKTKRTM